MKKTPWFDGSVKPVRDGVYERQYLRGEPMFCSWSARRGWSWANTTPEHAKADKLISGTQTLPWRGLAQKP